RIRDDVEASTIELTAVRRTFISRLRGKFERFRSGRAWQATFSGCPAPPAGYADEQRLQFSKFLFRERQDTFTPCYWLMMQPLRSHRMVPAVGAPMVGARTPLCPKGRLHHRSPLAGPRAELIQTKAG